MVIWIFEEGLWSKLYQRSNRHDEIRLSYIRKSNKQRMLLDQSFSFRRTFSFSFDIYRILRYSCMWFGSKGNFVEPYDTLPDLAYERLIQSCSSLFWKTRNFEERAPLLPFLNKSEQMLQQAVLHFVQETLCKRLKRPWDTEIEQKERLQQALVSHE